jgi:hypothetical protein
MGADPATWDMASYEAHPVDEIEPSELPENEYRQAARRFLIVINAVDQFMCSTHTGLPPRKWVAVSLALGLASTRGQTETAVAIEWGVTRAAISKDVVAILKLAHLENDPAWGLKSPEQREIYKRTNGRRLEEADVELALTVVDSGT